LAHPKPPQAGKFAPKRLTEVGIALELVERCADFSLSIGWEPL
jgi:hypothetical protein